MRRLKWKPEPGQTVNQINSSPIQPIAMAPNRKRASNSMRRVNRPKNFVLHHLPALGMSVALLVWIISLVIPANHSDVIRSPALPLTSSSSLNPLAGPIPQSITRTESKGVEFQFNLKVNQLDKEVRILELGTGKHAINVLMSKVANGSRTLVVQTTLTNGQIFNAILVGDVTEDLNYSITISILDSINIEGSVNGIRQFELSSGGSQFDTRITSFLIGGNQKASGFRGQVSQLRVHNESVGEVRDPYINPLREVGLALAALILIGGVLRISTRFTRRTENEKPFHVLELERLLATVHRNAIFLGLILIVVGVVGFAIVTPAYINDGSRVGYQRISLPTIPPGTSAGVLVGSESQNFSRASSIDLKISAKVNVRSYKNLKKSQIVFLVNDWTGSSGGAIILTSSGELIGAIGVHNSSPIFLDFEKVVPTNVWLDLTMEFQRNQTYVMLVDGEVVATYTYSDAILNAAPSNFIIGAQGSPYFDGTIQDATESISLFNSNRSDIPWNLLPEEEALFGILTASGIILLSRRFLSSLFPRAIDAKRPLVIISLGTSGVLTVVNILIDALHLQKGSPSGFPRSSWLWMSNVRFTDFYQTFELLKSGNPYGPQQGSYPPFGYLILEPLTWLNQWAAFYIVLSLFLGFIVWWALRVFGPPLRTLEKLVMLIFIGLSLPVTFVIDRGNTVMLAFLMLAVGAAAVKKDQVHIAAVSIGLFAATKIFPALYLLVFLWRRKWRPIAIGLGVMVGISLLGFLSFDGSLIENIEGFRRALGSVEQSYNSAQSSTYYNSTIYGWLQAVGYVFHGISGADSVRLFISHIVLPTEVISMLSLAWYLKNREAVLWRSMSLITLWLLLFPDVAGYYDLLYLLVPLAIFVQQASISKRTLWISVLFGASIAPKAYFYLGVSAIDVSVLFTAPILIGLSVLIIRDGMSERNAFDLQLGDGIETSTAQFAMSKVDSFTQTI